MKVGEARVLREFGAQIKMFPCHPLFSALSVRFGECFRACGQFTIWSVSRLPARCLRDQPLV